MGVGTGTGVVTKGRVTSGLIKKVASGVAIGALTLSLAACSSSGGTGVKGLVTLQKALDDYKAGNVSLAKSEFQQLVKDNPNDKYGWYNLGVLAQYAGNSGEAGKDYERALSIDPNFESPLYNYGLLKVASGDTDKAIELLGKAATVNPKDASALWQYGLALARRGKPADNKLSTIELNKALKIDPTLIKSLPGAQTGVTTTTAAAKSVSTAPASTKP